ncbi:MAG: hypothetical protein UU87_C0003G0148 [Parcubacteria group bacterium GW2011_GWA2_42_11]|nr:MAG: hypothetical protein UU87_C0003G0148 [Parcubacteria group bacterium GW2011_GWA2_42_11]KKT76478.1 MAG: hypothetical protein UW72_C0005G0046 [Parcubacteria group bacterium GW2011_GWF2_44_7]
MEQINPAVSDNFNTINPQPVKNRKTLLVLSIVLGILFLAAGTVSAYYWFVQNYTQKACTMEAKICPDGSSVGRTGANCEFAACPSVSPQKITDIDCGAAEKYLDKDLGIAFCYPKMLADKQVQILKEGNNIYVGGKNGQYLKVLSKDPNLSAEEGIGKAILTGYPAEDCFINNRTNEQYIKDNFPNGYYYISPVDYPNIAKGDEPFWIGSGKCPNEYAKTNGIRYFLGDENHPDKFLFFSIGQYGIPLDENNNDSKLWQSTVRFID